MRDLPKARLKVCERDLFSLSQIQLLGQPRWTISSGLNERLMCELSFPSYVMLMGLMSKVRRLSKDSGCADMLQDIIIEAYFPKTVGGNAGY